MAQPQMKTKTERSIYKRLHDDADTFRSEWHIAERNTKHAREVITRWITEGILEQRVETPYPNSSYQKVGYRLAQQWRDESVLDETLLERQEELDAQAMSTREQLTHARNMLMDTWTHSRALIGADAPPADDDLSAALQEALKLVNTLRSVSQLTASDRIITQKRATIDAQVERRQIAKMADSDPGCDPLGGDA